MPVSPRTVFHTGIRTGVHTGVRTGPRTSFDSSPLVRVLADLQADEVADSKHSVAERLSQWIDWTAAVPLARALTGGEFAPSSRSTAAAQNSAQSLSEALHLVRTDLARSIAEEPAFAAEAPRRTDGAADTAGAAMPLPTPEVTGSAEDALAQRRRRHLTMQQAMEARIGPLRAQARAALTARSPELARLAALDAVMDEALTARQRHLLATVPAMVERHFQRPGKAQLSTRAEPVGLTLQRVLRAELTFRLQPIEGMIAALGDAADEANANAVNAIPQR